MSAQDIPCRVSADLRAKDRDETAARYDAPEFTYLEEDFRQILPVDLAGPMERLFSTIHQVEAIQGSYGSESMDYQKATEWLMEDLRRIEEQILILWENA